ncbi:MAG: lysophospholipid acyltransferase family protein [Planctomycetota bacterium]|jgi:1-acyl-sn-glycerol-3-phosphate acyltransferase
MKRASRKRKRTFPGRELGRFARVLWPLTQYIVTNLTVIFGYFFFCIFLRTRVIGRENVPVEPNTLLLSNHQTLIDSFLVGICAFCPQTFMRPRLMPWNPAAEENFYGTRLLAWLADNWKCIPIKEGRKDWGSLRRMVLGLKTSPMILFPEGTRSRDGSIGKARAGAGLLILLSKPKVVPVAIDGADEVLPIGSVIPRIFKRVTVRYGKPLDLSRYYGQKKSKATAKKIMDEVMDAIRALRRETIAENNGVDDADPRILQYPGALPKPRKLGRFENTG